MFDYSRPPPEDWRIEAELRTDARLLDSKRQTTKIFQTHK